MDKQILLAQKESQNKSKKLFSSPPLNEALLAQNFSHEHRIKITRWYPIVSSISQKYQMDPKLVLAVIHVESRFNPLAVSPAGARGIMQLIPETAARFGVRNIHDPVQNIEGGIKYLRFLLNTFGNPYLALAGYNAGENNVLKHRGIPPFPETQNYVQQVLSIYRRL